MIKKKFDAIAVIEIIVVLSILASFLIISSVFFSGLRGITGYFAYSSSATTNLTVWDDTNDAEGENTQHLTNEQIGFYANYTNTTGEPINGTDINCAIKFNLTGSWQDLDNMTFNSTNRLYEYNRSFSLNGTFYFNVLCNGSALGYNILNASDDFVVSSFVSITNCTNINTPGIYYLQNDIIDSPTSYCINIQVNGVVLDCQGNMLDGNGIADYGIYISRPAPDNTSAIIRNCTLTDWDTAGLYIRYGLNNTIYNNLFNNTNNLILVPGSNQNKWNITKTFGTNMLGGPYLGGNFWAHPNGTGFSETCNDTDSDGICDINYTLATNNIDYLPLAYPDAFPFVNLISPANGQDTTSTDIAFKCNATDDKDLKNISLYVWTSTGGVFYQNNTNISGISNSSTWQVTNLTWGNYKWNCFVYDGINQSSWGSSNYTLTISEETGGGGGGGGGGGIAITPSAPPPPPPPPPPPEPGSYESTEEIGGNVDVSVDVETVYTGEDYQREGILLGSVINSGDKKLENVSIIGYIKGETETRLMIENRGVNNVNPKAGIDSITGFAVRKKVDIPVLEDIKSASKTHPLIIQKFVQYNIGPGIYLSTSQVNQKPLKTEPIKKYIAPLLKPGESITFEINISLGLAVEDKILVMEFKSFGETFATKEVILKAEPPVFGFSLEQDEESNIADAYIIISNINHEETEYFVGLEIDKPPAPGYERELGIKGLFKSLSEGPSATYYDYLGPYTLKTDESTLLTQRFIFDKVPADTYTFNAILYYNHRPLSRISHDIDIKR